MQIVKTLNDLPKQNKPVILTVGMFDGVHIGHQKILSFAKDKASEKKTHLTTLTFENHPLDILRPQIKIKRICTNDEKLALLKHYGVNLVILLQFTNELSKLTSEQFLEEIYTSYPFSDLVLGHDATIGSDQKENKKHVIKACQRLSVSVHYLEAVKWENVAVSSSRIRKAIDDGHLDLAKNMLGHELPHKS